jgi:hypothetical protein
MHNHLFAKEKGLTNYIFFDEELDFLPTKISNNQNATKYFLKIVQNPSKFYDPLDYNKKKKVPIFGVSRRVSLFDPK